MKALLKRIYVFLYPIFFLYGKKDKVEFLTDKYKTRKGTGAKGSIGFVCEIKYHSYLGWMYNIDCLTGFVMVRCKDVKRISRGWVHKFKLRFKTLDDLAKEEQTKEVEEWTIIQDN